MGIVRDFDERKKMNSEADSSEFGETERDTQRQGQKRRQKQSQGERDWGVSNERGGGRGQTEVGRQGRETSLEFYLVRNSHHTLRVRSPFVLFFGAQDTQIYLNDIRNFKSIAAYTFPHPPRNVTKGSTLVCQNPHWG